MKQKLLQFRFVLFLLLAGHTAFSQTAWQSGLIAYFKLNGNADNFFIPSESGITNCSPAPDRNGKPNSVLYFNGSKSMSVAYSTESKFRKSASNVLSFSVWVKPQDLATSEHSYTLISKFSKNNASDNKEYFVYITPQGRIVCMGNSAVYSAATVAVMDTSWQHIVVVMGAPYQTSVKVYRNGQLLSFEGYSAVTFNDNFNKPLFNIPLIGMCDDYNMTSFDYYKGLMDELYFYNRELSQDEVTALYHAGEQSDINITSPKPKSSWLLSEPIKINWSGNVPSGINIEYSTDNSSSWLPVVSAVTDTFYNWNASNIEPYKYFKLRLANVDNLSDYQIIDSLKLVKSSLEKGLLAHYLFDGNARDTSDNAKHGTTTCSPTTDRNGENEKALNFSEGNGVTTPALDYSKTGKVTYCAWVKAFSFATDWTHISSLMGTWDNKAKCLLRIGDSDISNNRPQLVIGDYKLNGNTLLEANKYYFIVATYDGAVMRLYINGMLDASAPIEQSFLISPEFYIGHSYNERYLNGVMDEARVYNRALSADEIGALYFKNEGINLSFIETDTVFFTSRPTKLQWFSNPDSVAAVNVKYSTNNGQSWTTIANDISADSLIWTTPANTVHNLLLRVESTAKPIEFIQRKIMIVSQKEYDLKLWLPLDGNTADSSIFHRNTFSLKANYGTDRFNSDNSCFGNDTSSLETTLMLKKNTFTTLFWLKTLENNIDKASYIFWGARFTLSVNYQNKLRIRYYNQDNNWTTYTSTDTINDGKWHFVAIINDSSGMKMYVDTTLVHNSPKWALLNEEFLYIGCSEQYAGVIYSPFIGNLDDIKIYDRVLDLDEVRMENCQRNFIVNAGSDKNICLGNTATLKAAGNFINIQWNNGIQDNVAFVPTQTSEYVVSSTFDYGCFVTDTLVVTLNPLPTVNVGTDKELCFGETTTLNATGNFASITWNNGVNSNTAFAPAETKAYIVTATSDKGCTNTDTVVVTVNPLPTVNAGTDKALCYGMATTLEAQGNFTSVTWNNGVNNNTAFAPAETKVYIATATSDKGCTNTDTVVVTVNPLPTVNAGEDMTVDDGNNLTLTASGNAISFSWDNGVSNNIPFIPIETKPYVVTGTSDKGCTATDTIFVTVDKSTGLTPKQISGSLVKLFPIPTNNKVLIQSEATIKTVQVYNNQGQLMDCNLTNEYIDLSRVSSGIYIIKIQTTQGWINSKVIKY